MANADSETVVAYSHLKQAALYFPYLVPLPFFILEDAIVEAVLESLCHGNVGVNFEQRIFSQIPDNNNTWRRLLPPSLRSDRKFFALLQKVLVWDGLQCAVVRLLDSLEEANRISERKAEVEALVRPHLRLSLFHERALETTFTHLVNRYALHQFPALISEDFESQVVEPGPGSEDFRLSLINLDLIDPATATWEQICEFKEDLESQKKLQRLRRFFLQNYSGLSKAEIADDLQARLDDHAVVVRKFGFDVKQTMLEAFSSSKQLHGGLSGAVIAAFCENPLAAFASAAGGTLLELGNTALKLRRLKFEYRESIEQHPLGYLIRAKEQLGNRNES